MIPLAFSRPAGFHVAPTDKAIPFKMCSGFHSVSANFLIARAPNLGAYPAIAITNVIDKSAELPHFPQIFPSWPAQNVCSAQRLTTVLNACHALVDDRAQFGGGGAHARERLTLS